MNLDFIDRSEHLFREVDLEVSLLLKIVHDFHEDPKRYCPAAIEKVEKVLSCAARIGGKFFDDAKTLRTELYAFLEKPSEETWMKITQHILHIKQETREI